MKTVEAEYDKLKIEVEIFRNKIIDINQSNPQINALYNGCKILFSPIRKKSDFLIIGINPGIGTESKDNELEPTKGVEYIDAEDEYDYAIASQTRKVFHEAGLFEKLEECVKTNYYYFTSSNTVDLQKLLKSYGSETEHEFYVLAKRWTQILINIVDPKIILCEGKLAFDRIKDLYSVNPIWMNEIGYFETPDQKLVIGYKRRYSNILHKEKLIDFLIREVKPRL
jgi:hypothetical protein